MQRPAWQPYACELMGPWAKNSVSLTYQKEGGKMLSKASLVLLSKNAPFDCENTIHFFLEFEQIERTSDKPIAKIVSF